MRIARKENQEFSRGYGNIAFRFIFEKLDQTFTDQLKRLQKFEMYLFELIEQLNSFKTFAFEYTYSTFRSKIE